MARPPTGFTPIAEAFLIRNGATFNIMGVCTDSLPPRTTYGTDSTMKMVLWDPSCMDNPDLGNKGMVVRYFRGDINVMPNIQEAGDVVILRNALMRNVKGQFMGLSNWNTRWNVIPAPELTESSAENLMSIQQRPFRNGQPGTLKEQGPQPTEQERKYAKKILDARSSSAPIRALAQTPHSVASSSPSSAMLTTGQRPKSLKFRLVKDLRDQRQNPSREFVDLVGEIQHVFLGRNPVEVKITDYTEHPCLYQADSAERDGDEFGYTRRSHQPEDQPRAMTITLNAWDAQGDNIRHLAESGQLQLGMYCQATNVCVKLDRNGTVLEGHLRSAAGESTTSFSLLQAKQASRITSLENLLERKRAYEKTLKADVLGLKAAQQEDQAPPLAKQHDNLMHDPPQSRKRDTPADEESEEPDKPLSKNAKKKQRKFKQAEEKRKRQDEAEARTNQDNPSKPREKHVKEAPMPYINPNIRCQDCNIGLTRLSTILDEKQLEHKTQDGKDYKWPFQNRKYKSKVRVIDFFPPLLEDFTSLMPKRRRSSTGSATSEQSLDNTLDDDGDKDARWQWNFYLIVEDADAVAGEEKGMMLLQVAGEDGDQLFNMEACDLRKRTNYCAEMKNKLFMLWGELHEKMEETGKNGWDLHKDGIKIRSVPFVGLIKEFGVQAYNKSGEVLDGQWERCHRLFGTRIVK